MNTADRFPVSFLWENADKAMAFAIGLPPGGARDFFLAIAGRMLDDRYHFSEALPDPATPVQATDPSAASAPHSFNFTATQEPTSIRVNGPCRAGMRGPDGVDVWVSYSTEAGDNFVEGSASRGNGAAEILVPAGVWCVNAKLGKDMPPSAANVYLGLV